MNEETTLLRAGRFKDASPHTAEKTRLAQDYVGYVRAVQRQSQRLLKEAPEAVQMLRAGHEQLVTQMAENLRVIATARTVTEDLLTDVATTVGQQQTDQDLWRVAASCRPRRRPRPGARDQPRALDGGSRDFNASPLIQIATGFAQERVSAGCHRHLRIVCGDRQVTQRIACLDRRFGDERRSPSAAR